MSAGITPILWGPRYYAKRAIAKQAAREWKASRSGSETPAIESSPLRRTTRAIELTRWVRDTSQRGEQTFLELAFGELVPDEVIAHKARVGAHAVAQRIPDSAGTLVLIVGGLQSVYDVKWAPGVLVQLIETIFQSATRLPFRMVFALDGGMPEFELVLNQTALGTQRGRLEPIQVKPLTLDETGRAAKREDLAFTANELAEIHRLTRGHPYFVLTGFERARHGQLTGAGLIKLYNDPAPRGGPFDAYFSELDRAATAAGAEFILRDAVQLPGDGPIKRFVVEWGLEIPRPPVIDQWASRRFGAR